jgi:uncharacterized protein (TIRG00374 family)
MSTAASDDLFPADIARKVWPFLVFGVVAYICLFFYGDALETSRCIRRISLLRIVIALNLSVLSFVVRTWRWNFFLRQIHRTLPPRITALVFFVGLAMTITPAKCGEVVKSLMLKEAFCIPVAKSAPILVAERVTDLVAVVVVGGFGLLAIPDASLGALAAFFAAFAVISLFSIQSAGLFGIRLLAKVPGLSSRREKLQISYLALRDLSRPSVLAVALPLSIIAWAVQGSIVWVLAGGLPATNVSPLEGLAAYCAPLLAGALALVPGGLGATEASMTGVLVAIGGPGLTRSVAVALTVVVRLVTFWFAILLGLTALTIWRLRRSKLIQPMDTTG